MNKDLEALILAFDAVNESNVADRPHRRMLYEQRLEEFLARFPNLDRKTLDALVAKQHYR